MSIARAFTTRRAKQGLELRDGSDGVQRSNTTKTPLSIRHKISAPVELIHTTNMLSYNAPDLFPKSAGSSHNSSKSDDESDAALTAASTPPTSPDSPFPEKRSISPEPNHLSCYFTAPSQAISNAPVEAPAIPKRAPSHTKKSYDGLVRHRSTSRMSEQSQRTLSTKASFSFSRSSSTSTSNSSAPATSPLPPSVAQMPKISSPIPISSTQSVPPVSHKKDYSESHPFGHELAQVSELAEEFSKQPINVMDEEERQLREKGLNKFTAEDYLGEIQGLLSSIFADTHEDRPVAALWI
jgi:hypothetical protein